MQLSRYALWYALSVVLLALAVGVCNAVIDPQGRLLWVDKAGFNQFKVALPTNNRGGKARALRQCDYEVIVLGTSRAESGIKTEQPAFSGKRVYNAALKAASMYELRRVGEYAVAHSPVDTVVIGLDFVSFNDRFMTFDDFDETLLAKRRSWLAVARYLVSVQTLLESVATLRWNRISGIELCGDNGEHKRRAGSNPADKASAAFAFILKRYARGQYDGYEPGAQHLDDLAALLELLNQKKVRVYAFVSPVHVSHIELLREMGMLQVYQEWKRSILDVFVEAQENSGQQARPVLWDFSGYNEITTEEIPPSAAPDDIRWYRDSAHYRSTVGEILLRRMTGMQVSPEFADFGIELTPGNIDKVLAREREGSEQFRVDQPGQVEKVRAIMREALAE